MKQLMFAIVFEKSIKLQNGFFYPRVEVKATNSLRAPGGGGLLQ